MLRDQALVTTGLPKEVKRWDQGCDRGHRAFRAEGNHETFQPDLKLVPGFKRYRPPASLSSKVTQAKN